MSTQQMTGPEVKTELDEDDPFELLTAEEVARWLRLTTAWVYTQTRSDRIPHVTFGRYVRYRRSAIAQWLRENESQGR